MADKMKILDIDSWRKLAIAVAVAACLVGVGGCTSFQNKQQVSTYSRNNTTGWERFKKSSKNAWNKTWEFLDPYPSNPSPPPKWIPQPETKKPSSVEEWLGQPRVGT